MRRCDWVFDDIHIKYHDNEWGVPLHNDRKLFEFLVLDGMQSGLSWKIILNKRNSFRQAFDNFDPKKISAYKEKDVGKLLANEGIIRNRRKIDSAINNSKIFLKTKKEFEGISKTNDEPLSALKIRLAKGEITKEEFDKIKEDLK
ncbi:MAG: DNA-3-methyladenine glycosylase I [Bacteroidetes bacterium]|nr:DNA-3-methyladenine glycosylase I [Bacteroidota bacterium]